jgi:hypothetical protein
MKTKKKANQIVTIAPLMNNSTKIIWAEEKRKLTKENT